MCVARELARGDREQVRGLNDRETMDRQFQFIPDQASTIAPQIDALFYFLTAVTAFFTIGIFVAILYLGLKYRRRPGIKPVEVPTNAKLEIAWTVIPLALC